MSKTQVYCAVSLDGFIAGPGDDLSWLGNPEQTGEPGTISYLDFIKQVGAVLLGRRTFDVVMGFGGDWPYGTLPVIVATTRPLSDAPPTVSARQGKMRQLCAQAKRLAGDRNVYLDGGNIISQALDSGCVDQLILTIAPVILGQGTPLYCGSRLHRFGASYLGRFGTMHQFAFHVPKSEPNEPIK